MNQQNDHIVFTGFLVAAAATGIISSFLKPNTEKLVRKPAQPPQAAPAGVCLNEINKNYALFALTVAENSGFGDFPARRQGRFVRLVSPDAEYNIVNASPETEKIIKKTMDEFNRITGSNFTYVDRLRKIPYDDGAKKSIAFYVNNKLKSLAGFEVGRPKDVQKIYINESKARSLGLQPALRSAIYNEILNTAFGLSDTPFFEDFSMKRHPDPYSQLKDRRGLEKQEALTGLDVEMARISMDIPNGADVNFVRNYIEKYCRS
jgi:hypothetical protein